MNSRAALAISYAIFIAGWLNFMIFACDVVPPNSLQRTGLRPPAEFQYR